MTLHGGFLKSDKQYVAFRVDASAEIGTGHLMRCFTLASQLQKTGIKVAFICRHITNSLAQKLIDNNCDLRVLKDSDADTKVDELAHSKWLGVSQLKDAESAIRALSDRKWDWLIVDHYALDTRWENQLRISATKIMVIDDLADRNHDCDLLLDQNFYLDMDNRYEDKVFQNCHLLLGPKYALLRPEFLEIRNNLKVRKNQVERVLVFFGGIDSEDYTSRTISALSRVANFDLNIDVVIGSNHPCKSKIVEECNRLGYVCHIQTEQMATLIANADMAIGAGGSATWERCALGLPTITLPIAKNQQKLTYDAAEAGLVYSPKLDLSIENEIFLHFLALLNNPALRKSISEKGKQFVDCKGISRVINILFPHEILLYEAKETDMRSLYVWRNDTKIRKFSRNKSLISWDDHQQWFINTLSRDDVKLLIGRLNNQDVGVVRFNFEGSNAEISIYLVPNMHNAGMGSALLQSSEKWLRTHYPHIYQIDAEVMADNYISKKFFSKNGFTCAACTYFKRINS